MNFSRILGGVIFSFFLPHFFFRPLVDSLNVSQLLNPQHRSKVAYHRPWRTDNSLVPVTLCSLSANLRYGRTRNYGTPPHGCPWCSKLYHISNTVRLSSYTLPSIGRVLWFNSLLTSYHFWQLKCGAPVPNKEGYFKHHLANLIWKNRTIECPSHKLMHWPKISNRTS